MHVRTQKQINPTNPFTKFSIFVSDIAKTRRRENRVKGTSTEKMGLRSSSVLCLALFLAFSSSINGLDITKLLGQYPEFSSFNKYLTETKLAEQINGDRNGVTILALDNAALSSLSGKSPDAIKAIIGTHVLSEFYDEKKLMEAQGSHTPLATLSPATGLANSIYVSLVDDGEVVFGSAVKGSALDTKLVKTVTTEPGTVAVLQVTQPILVPGAQASTPAGGSVAESPKSHGAAAPAPASSSSRTHMGFLGAVMAFVSLFASL